MKPQATTILRSMSTVLTQFWKPRESYRLLLDNPAASAAMVASILMIAIAGFAPALVVNWEEFESGWRTERVPELTGNGMSPSQADSVVSGEISDIREMAGNLPMASVVERGVIGLIAALSAFGIVYAIEGRKFGRLMNYVTSSMLSQSAYMICAAILIILLTVLNIPPDIRINLSAFVPVDTPDPSRIHVFLFRFLESFDIPSVVCLFLWGTGLSAMLDRDRSWGLRLAFSVYILGVMLISLPVMFAQAA